MAKKVAVYGMLIALAFIFSYLESLIPIPIPVQGIKLGLANLVVVLALYLLGEKPAFSISIVRILLVGFTFGGMSTMLYSLVGGIASLGMMIILKKTKWFSMVGISIIGGVFHNIGQICVAAIVLESGTIFAYLPVLLLSGCITGAMIGLLTGIILPRVGNL